MEPQLPFSVIVPTFYGQMMINRYDINQTNSLFKTGLAMDHNEILLLANLLQLCPANPTFVDVGANFGTYTLALAGIVGPLGRVHSFEPQRVIYNLLVGTISLNSLTHVYCHNTAVGDREGTVEIPQFDYRKPLNFGSIEFTPQQQETLTQQRMHDPAAVEHVPVRTLDSFNFPRVDVIKIDAEGMENQVLDGFRQTMQRCRPVMYIEFLKVDRDALRNRLEADEYAIYVNQINFLCIPKEKVEHFKVTAR